MSLNELSEYLRTPKSTLYKLSEADKIPSFKVGKELRFKRGSIDRWIGQQEKPRRKSAPPYGDRVFQSLKQKPNIITDVTVTKDRKENESNLSIGLGAVEASLRTRIKLYKRRSQEIEQYLAKKPDEWGKFQNEFNSEVNGFFREIMNFEKINLNKGSIEKVHKLKRIFINRIRELFLKGVYIVY